MKRIGILTSGGDCPGLNAAIRGVAKSVYGHVGDDVEIVGIADGYTGLIDAEYKVMKPSDFSGLLTLGGTILGTSRQPYSTVKDVVGDDYTTKIDKMKQSYQRMGLSCLLTLGGNGTHKTSYLLSQEGLNVIGLPKTIDNDIYGTEFTFGFHTAVDINAEIIDRLHSTADSHGRVMVVEIMGNKAGWLTLYSAVAGGADVVVVPEIPYNMESIIAAIENRTKQGKDFSIVAVAEGAVSKQEANLKRKEREQKRDIAGYKNAYQYIAKEIEKTTGRQTRTVVPGYIQRGGSPCAYDRVLSTLFGVAAARAVKDGIFGISVALRGENIVYNPLSEVASKTKFLPTDNQLIRTARAMGVSFAD